MNKHIQQRKHVSTPSIHSYTQTAVSLVTQKKYIVAKQPLHSASTRALRAYGTVRGRHLRTDHLGEKKPVAQKGVTHIVVVVDAIQKNYRNE